MSKKVYPQFNILLNRKRILSMVRASPVTSCTCICIRERKVGSIRDAKANVGKSASHARILAALIYPKLPMYQKPGTTKLTVGLSYLTSTIYDGCLIQIANSLLSRCYAGGRQFLLKFLSGITINRDHWATFLDLHLHHGWKSADADTDPGPLGLP